MTSPLHNRVEQAMAEFEQQKAAVTEFERDISAARTTVTPKSRAVSVTVDGRGDLAELRFPTRAYRTMAPAELAGLLIDTIRDAQKEARDKAAQMFHSLMPAGSPVLDMLSGPVDFDATMSEILQVFEETKQPSAAQRNADGEAR
jgi:DNA-binding protein YbaB